MAIVPNRVFPLRITTLSPLHIGTGARLAANVDYYTDSESNTTFVIDTNAALDLVIQQWESNREPYEEIMRRYAAELDHEATAIQEANARLRNRVEAFDSNPPRRADERERQETRLLEDAARLKERRKRLNERRATPPPPTTQVLPDILIGNSSLHDLVAGGHLPLASLHERALVDGRPVVRYAFSGRPAANEIYELIKNVRDQLYIPGSSLKGALRSALAWDLALNVTSTAFQLIGQRSAKASDDQIEQAIFWGQDQQKMNNTARDVLRTLHIGDSTPAQVDPELLAVRMYRSNSVTMPVAIEAIPTGTTFSATLQVERYAFENAKAQAILDFGSWQQQLSPDALTATCRRRAAALITGELGYYARFSDAGEVSRFYSDLQARLEHLPTNTFLLPVGWGAGWRSKTLDDRLRVGDAREAAFVQAVQRFKLKKHKSEQFRSGGSFPDTRKVVLHGDRLWRPLGWVEVAIGEERR